MMTAKQIMLTGALALGVLSTQAQNQDYKGPLKTTWDAMDSTRAPEQKVALSNKLGLIAKKWAGEWATHYYNALGKVYVAYDEKDEAKVDALLDEADKEREETLTLMGNKENDETYVLAAMIANCRMKVNPMQRWQKYGKVFQDNIKSAEEVNAANPRLYYFKGVTTLYTPKNFGGGKKAALPYFEKAAGLYAKETPDDINKPYWGKAKNTFFMGEANKED